MNSSGIVLLVVIAVFIGGLWIIAHSGNTNCKRFETKLVEMPYESSHGPSGVRTYQYKVCAE